MSPLAGTATLLRLMARRDRIRTPAWIAGIVFFTAYVTIEVAALGDDPQSLANSAVLFADAMGDSTITLKKIDGEWYVDIDAYLETP